MRSVGLALLLAAVSANAFGAFHPSAPCHEHPCPICPTCHVCPKPPEPEPMTCPALIDHLQADDADAALLKMAYSAGDATAFLTYIKDAKPVGYHTDLIPEASDAVQTNAPVMVRAFAPRACLCAARSSRSRTARPVLGARVCTRPFRAGRQERRCRLPARQP